MHSASEILQSSRCLACWWHAQRCQGQRRACMVQPSPPPPARKGTAHLISTTRQRVTSRQHRGACGEERQEPRLSTASSPLHHKLSYESAVRPSRTTPASPLRCSLGFVSPSPSALSILLSLPFDAEGRGASTPVPRASVTPVCLPGRFSSDHPSLKPPRRTFAGEKMQASRRRWPDYDVPAPALLLPRRPLRQASASASGARKTLPREETTSALSAGCSTRTSICKSMGRGRSWAHVPRSGSPRPPAQAGSGPPPSAWFFGGVGFFSYPKHSHGHKPSPGYAEVKPS